MQISVKHTNLGVALSIGDGVDRIPEPSPDADQMNPRKCYVYAHEDQTGRIFYVGKGVGRRAWSKDRHPLWTRYVEKHLKDEFRVRILRDNLTTDAAEEVEAEWVYHLGSTLLNWVNTKRETNFKALALFNQRRDANKRLINDARKLEATDLVRAADMYADAVAAIPSYVSIEYEGGLVGQLLAEESAEYGAFGEIEALDRLTMCLIKLGRATEAASQTEAYFKLYARDLNKSAAERIKQRVEKAVAKIRTAYQSAV